MSDSYEIGFENMRRTQGLDDAEAITWNVEYTKIENGLGEYLDLMKWQSTSGFLQTKIELFIADEFIEKVTHNPYRNSLTYGMFNIVPAAHLGLKHALYQTIEAPNRFFWEYIYNNKDKFWISTSRLVAGQYEYKDGLRQH